MGAPYNARYSAILLLLSIALFIRSDGFKLSLNKEKIQDGDSDDEIVDKINVKKGKLIEVPCFKCDVSSEDGIEEQKYVFEPVHKLRTPNENLDVPVIKDKDVDKDTQVKKKKDDGEYIFEKVHKKIIYDDYFEEPAHKNKDIDEELPLDKKSEVNQKLIFEKLHKTIDDQYDDDERESYAINKNMDKNIFEKVYKPSIDNDELVKPISRYKEVNIDKSHPQKKTIDDQFIFDKIDKGNDQRVVKQVSMNKIREVHDRHVAAKDQKLDIDAVHMVETVLKDNYVDEDRAVNKRREVHDRHTSAKYYEVGVDMDDLEEPVSKDKHIDKDWAANKRREVHDRHVAAKEQKVDIDEVRLKETVFNDNYIDEDRAANKRREVHDRHVAAKDQKVNIDAVHLTETVFNDDYVDEDRAANKRREVHDRHVAAKDQKVNIDAVQSTETVFNDNYVDEDRAAKKRREVHDRHTSEKYYEVDIDVNHLKEPVSKTKSVDKDWEANKRREVHHRHASTKDTKVAFGVDHLEETVFEDNYVDEDQAANKRREVHDRHASAKFTEADIDVDHLEDPVPNDQNNVKGWGTNKGRELNNRHVSKDPKVDIDVDHFVKLVTKHKDNSKNTPSSQRKTIVDIFDFEKIHEKAKVIEKRIAKEKEEIKNTSTKMKTEVRNKYVEKKHKPEVEDHTTNFVPKDTVPTKDYKAKQKTIENEEKTIIEPSKKETEDIITTKKDEDSDAELKENSMWFNFLTFIRDSLSSEPVLEQNDTKSQKEEITKVDSRNEQKEYSSSGDLSALYQYLPTFAPNYNKVNGLECKRHGQILMRQLRGNRLWALQMLDSTAKIPSGILKGNLNQLGDFDECIEISTRVRVDPTKPGVPIKGKYCLAEIDISAVEEDMKLPVHLAQARSFIRSRAKDPGHFIPKFTTLHWGLCLPDGCDSEDAENILKDSIRHYNMSTGVKIALRIEENMCYVKTNTALLDYSVPTIATIAFYTVVLLVTAIATLKDCWKKWTSNETVKTNKDDQGPELNEEDEDHKGPIHRILMAFSLKRTHHSLVKKGSADGEIECIHGIRAMSTVALYIAHKILPVSKMPFSNRIYLTEVSNSPWSLILRCSLVYTDTFLLISGVLTAYHMGKDMTTKGSIPWFTRYISRFIRLTPAVLAVLLFYAYIWEHIGSGPQWNAVVASNANLCKQNMWANLLYIQNYFPFEEMCATHTHQLALDMQLTLIAPILVWLFYKRPIWGFGVIGSLHAMSIGLRYYSTINNRLSLIVFHGMSLSQLYRTANFSYASVLHRATPYLTGIGLGVLLRQTGKNIRMPKVVVAAGWMAALYFFGWTFNAPAHLSRRDYQYNPVEAAQLSAQTSVAWALGLSWLIFACFTEHGGIVNAFLVSRPMVLLSRISYGTYLVQFAVFFYTVGTARSSSEFELSTALDLREMCTVLISAVIVTLLFDLPMQTVKSIVMSSDVSSDKSATKEPALDIQEVEETQGTQQLENQEDEYEQEEYQQEEYQQEENQQEEYQQDAKELYNEENYEYDEELDEDSDQLSESYERDNRHREYEDEYDEELDEEEEEEDGVTEPISEEAVAEDDLRDWEWTVKDD